MSGEPPAVRAPERLPLIVSRLLLLILAIAVAALAITSVRLDSATADEGAHIAAGVIKLRHGWLSFFPEQPPLMNVISALPLGSFTMNDAWRANLHTRGHWAAGHALLYESGNDAYRLLFLARLPTIALFLALCFTVYLFVAAETHSRTWGLVAFALTGFCPNLLAHGRLATVDAGMTAFAFISFALVIRLLQRRHRLTGAKAVGLGSLAGFFAMCAILSKTSGVLLVPFFALVVALHAWRRRSWRPFVLPLLAAIVAAVATLYAVTFALASDAWLAAQYGGTPRILVPWLQYQSHVDAIRFWFQSGHEHPQFLLGDFSRQGWPHFYLVAFLLKTPLAALLLFAFAAAAAVRRRSFAADVSLLFVVLFFAVSATSRIALGLRYVLPVYPFLYAATAILLSRLVIDRKRALLVAALVAWFCISSIVAWPSYVSYFNELIGGHRNADRFLIDSNLDWGQDLRRLGLWIDANGVDFIRVDYFGAGDIRYELGDRAERWAAPRPEPLPPGWFAVSRHFYRASFDPRESPVDYDSYLEASGAEYVATVGGSIDVYRVDGPRRLSR
jgi:4-amino-4-deoxy-L-arabinose transferase-like glycosyltransferase